MTVMAAYQVILMLYGFIVPKVMLTFYGSEINGLVSSITQFITYLNLVEAGISSAAVFSLYKPLSENDHAAINGVVSAAKKYYFLSGYIFTGLMFALAVIYPVFKKTEMLSPPMMAILVIALGSKCFFEFFTLAKYRVILTADQKTYIISIASSVYQLMSLAIIIIMAFLRVNVVILYSAAVVALFARTIILRIYVRKNYGYLDYNAAPDNSALAKRWDVLVLQLLGVAESGAPVIIATVFTELVQVSVYTIYNMVIQGVQGIMGIFSNGLFPSFGEVIAKKQDGILKKSYGEFMYGYGCINAFVMSVTMVMILPFVRIYTRNVTDVNYDLPLLAFLFALNGFLYNLKTPQGMLVNSAGHYRQTRVQSTIQTLIIIVLGCVSAPFFGIVGIAAASCLSNLYRDIDLAFYTPMNITRTPVRETLLSMLWSALCFGLSAAAGYFIVGETNGILSWIINAFEASGIAIAIIALMSLLFYRKQLRAVLIRLKSLVVKK